MVWPARENQHVLTVTAPWPRKNCLELLVNARNATSASAQMTRKLNLAAAAAAMMRMTKRGRPFGCLVNDGWRLLLYMLLLLLLLAFLAFHYFMSLLQVMPPKNMASKINKRFTSPEFVESSEDSDSLSDSSVDKDGQQEKVSPRVSPQTSSTQKTSGQKRLCPKVTGPSKYWAAKVQAVAPPKKRVKVQKPPVKYGPSPYFLGKISLRISAPSAPTRLSALSAPSAPSRPSGPSAPSAPSAPSGPSAPTAVNINRKLSKTAVDKVANDMYIEALLKENLFDDHL